MSPSGDPENAPNPARSPPQTKIPNAITSIPNQIQSVDAGIQLTGM
jgi:hypothetical protein